MIRYRAPEVLLSSPAYGSAVGELLMKMKLLFTGLL